MTTFVLAGGCFWCLDSSYMQFKGVTDVEVGYMGGHVDNPGYEAVCDGTTGHAEVVLVVFDPAVVSYETLLKTFWETHDPTQGMRQGNDVGTQYRGAMFYENDAQRQLFEEALDRARGHWDGALVTQIVPTETFWVGEEYHQDFFAKNPNQGYCNAVVSPKMAKVRQAFHSYVK